eukprot:9384867-Heterocapsa_arctica.AAC.1
MRIGEASVPGLLEANGTRKGKEVNQNRKNQSCASRKAENEPRFARKLVLKHFVGWFLWGWALGFCKIARESQEAMVGSQCPKGTVVFSQLLRQATRHPSRLDRPRRVKAQAS